MLIRRGLDERLMWHVLILKFLDKKNNYSQEEIANILNIDRPTVNRIINRALEDGVVRYIIDPPKEYKLERRLSSIYNLEDTWIVGIPPNVDIDEELFLAMLGQFGAVCFENHLIQYHKDYLKTNDIETPLKVGMSGGKSIAAVCEALSGQNKIKIEVTPLAATLTDTGTFGPESSCALFVANYLSKFARVVQSFRHIPHFDEKEQRITSFSLEPKNKKKQEFNLALVGIGSVEKKNSTLEAALNLLPEQTRTDISKEIVGDIASCLICEDGSVYNKFGYSEKIIAVSPERLRDMYNDDSLNAKIIAVSGGSEKYKAIKAALLGGGTTEDPKPYFNVLVTDELTARKLIDEHDKNNEEAQS